MSISTIKNATLRRTTVVVAALPLFLLTFLWETVKIFRELCRDFPSAVREAWRGRP
jgi:hypothetical protein